MMQERSRWTSSVVPRLSYKRRWLAKTQINGHFIALCNSIFECERGIMLISAIWSDCWWPYRHYKSKSKYQTISLSQSKKKQLLSEALSTIIKIIIYCKASFFIMYFKNIIRIITLIAESEISIQTNICTLYIAKQFYIFFYNMYIKDSIYLQLFFETFYYLSSI